MFQGIDVDLVFWPVNGCGDQLRAKLEPVGPPGQQWLIGHPNYRGLELIRDLRRVVGCREHIPAAAIHFVGEGDRHRLPGHGHLKIGAQRDDPRNCGCPA